MPVDASQRGRRRGALPHQCPACRRHWALRVVHHPAGDVVLCRWCRSVRAAQPVALTACR